MAHKLLVVGGNGFVGSAVCRAALRRGWDVSSISPSGTPFRTPKGHTPEWTSAVAWHTASALTPASYRDLLPGTTAIVHTVGTLLEAGQYKAAVRTGDVGGLLSAVGAVLGGSSAGGNPLTRGEEGQSHAGSYETLNRDTALRVCETYVASVVDTPAATPHAFVYLSAEDMGRPFIPARYISTKRQAEQGIAALCRDTPVRGIFIRPSFIYHPHLRPITSPIAALASLSAAIHEHAPSLVPTPSRILRALASGPPPAPSAPPAPSSAEPPSLPALPSALHGLATTLELPPIHLDHVAEAVCLAIERKDVSGPVGLREMRRMVGWGGDARGESGDGKSSAE